MANPITLPGPFVDLVRFSIAEVGQHGFAVRREAQRDDIKSPWIMVKDAHVGAVNLDNAQVIEIGVLFVAPRVGNLLTIGRDDLVVVPPVNIIPIGILRDQPVGFGNDIIHSQIARSPVNIGQVSAVRRYPAHKV